jgi:hypothetical protein
LVTTSLSINSTGQLNLGGNDADIAGDLTSLSNQVASGYKAGLWNGYGITSSTAAGNTSHLTTIGVLKNNDGAGHTIYGTFDGSTPALNDILLKYTYYGDATLDGKVDGSDYTRIDNGYLNHTTGWQNGDFNYDGIVNGSDYTLIDNAFNTQGAQVTASIAGVTANPTAIIAVQMFNTANPIRVESVHALKADEVDLVTRSLNHQTQGPIKAFNHAVRRNHVHRKPVKQTSLDSLSQSIEPL